MKKLSYTLFANGELIGIVLYSVVCILLVCALFYFIKYRPKPTKQIKSPLPFVKNSHRPQKYTKADWFALVVVTCLYAIVSFTKLGSTKFVTTTWQPSDFNDSQSFILEVGDEHVYDQIMVLYGEGDNNSNPKNHQLGVFGMQITGSYDLQNWYPIATLEDIGIYHYEIKQGLWAFPYLKIQSTSHNQTISEITVKKHDENVFLPLSVYQDDYQNSTYPATLVIDEQDKVPFTPTYMDEAYFDEVYHPRNAYEIANGQHMYETVHPLFGTNIMALFIKLFGMSPFVWRLPGALFGVMILPMFYAICHLLFERTRYSFLGTLLVAGDFMHLTTSRIGTLEPFSVFFILAMLYPMLRFYRLNFYQEKMRSLLGWLLLSGVLLGIAISTKWTACYAALGLAILLFTNLFQRYREYKLSFKYQAQTEEEMLAVRQIQSTFQKKTMRVILYCFPFFIFLPIIIYWLSYLPDHVWREAWSIGNVWKQNVYMYNYHTNLQATHPYQSTWYQWVLDIRPIWYYEGVKDGMYHTISCFSNPLLTWVGLPCVLYTFFKAIKDKSFTAWAIFIGYITNLGPWILFVKRCVFAYHFYPTSFFVALSIVYTFKKLYDKNAKLAKRLMVVFAIAYVLLFVLFLPITAGFATNLQYIKTMEWFSTWYFG